MPETGESTPRDFAEESLFHRAQRSFRAGRHTEGIEMLRRGVTLGDADCQTFLAALYLEGELGIERDPAEARRLYELAVAQYNYMGTYLYGDALFWGKGLPKEKKRGLRLLKRAALMGVPQGQLFLSSYYGKRPWHGTKAAAWLLIAAENGVAEAREFIESNGLPSQDAQELAARITGAMNVLAKLLLPMDTDAGLRRLEQMVDEI